MPNLNYSTQGPQTQFTDRVYEHADNTRNIVMNNPEIATLSEPRISIHRTCKYISKLPYIRGFNPQPRTMEEDEANHRLKDSVFRQRDLDQVLKEGYYPTCSDIGLLFRGLMTAQGHLTTYIEAFHKDFILNIRPREADIMGHVLGRVYSNDGSSLIVDPKPNPKEYENEEFLFRDINHIIFREGLDSWDIGIFGYEDINRLKNENIEALLKRYEHNLRVGF